MRLKDWQQRPDLTEQARSWLEMDFTKLAISMLELEHIAHYVFPTQGNNPTDTTKRLGQIEGYQICLNNLQALGKLLTRPESVEADFSEENRRP